MCSLNAEKITEITQQYGDAFYLLDSKQFKDNFDNLTNEFKKIYSNFNIAYSYKTNYTPALCKIINEKHGYAEVVSEMELEIAIRIGVNPSKIIWNGPIKNNNAVKDLLLSGGTVNIDSIYELDFIDELADRYPEHTLNVGIRCNFDVGDGVISRFGIDVDSDDFNRAIDFVKSKKNLYLINLQCHFAKRNVEYWPQRAKGMATTVKKAANQLGYLPKRVDIGGGLYGNMDEFLKKQFQASIPVYSDYANAAATVFKEEFPNEDIELLIEPGSALVGDCMKFVGKVVTIKQVRGKTYITMLGSQKNISMTGVNPPIMVIPFGNERKTYKNADIVGYTCIENDVLFRNYDGELSVGDYIVFSNCGSYSIVMKPPFILPNFPIIDISDGNIQLIKKQENFDDIFHTYIF